ncbi:MAG TPA: tetracycline resistance MFS efflux pump, partial [Chitinophagaceae bacterium]|nr:tetracycline resistance MFS efflux pump [Chitinophagaceae bacterium]
LVGAAFGLGFIIGPVIGGLLGTFGPRVPFMVAAGLSFLNWLYGYFFLPESLPRENRRAFSWKRANAFGALKSLKKYKGMLGLMLTFFLVYVASHAVQSTWSFFTIEQFQWDETMIGISLGVVGVLVALVQGLLIRIVHPRLGNVKSVYLGFWMYFLGLILFAFASTSWMMFVFLIPYCLGGLGGPALQSLLSEQVPTQEQGELQGTLTSLISLTSIIGPPLMTGLFAAFTAKQAPVYFPGAAFLLAAVIMVISIYIAHLSLRARKSPASTA